MHADKVKGIKPEFIRIKFNNFEVLFFALVLSFSSAKIRLYLRSPGFSRS